MTREEAIKIMEMRECCRECVVSRDFTCKDCETAFDMAIKALEQEPCEDAVSREAVLDIFADNADAVRPYSKTWEEVKALPSVNPQRTGHWIEDEYEMEVRCSKCGEDNDECSKYCPNCGAKMVEQQERSEE